jgi:hypothetical protein
MVEGGQISNPMGRIGVGGSRQLGGGKGRGAGSMEQRGSRGPPDDGVLRFLRALGFGHGAVSLGGAALRLLRRRLLCLLLLRLLLLLLLSPGRLLLLLLLLLELLEIGMPVLAVHGGLPLHFCGVVLLLELLLEVLLVHVLLLLLLVLDMLLMLLVLLVLVLLRRMLLHALLTPSHPPRLQLPLRHRGADAAH